MAEADKTAGEKLVNSVALTLIARVAMVVATGLILPLALFLGQRGLSTVDEISRKIDSMREAAIEQSGEIKALRVQATAQQQIQADHEARVRILEATGRVAQPIARP